MSSDPRSLKKIINTVHSGIQSSISSIQRQGNSIFYSASIQQQKSEKCGWLRKQGGVVKTWHKRWFTIKGDYMYYFNTNDESKQPLGYIFLPGNKVIEHTTNSNENDKFMFEIIPGEDRERMTSSHETYPLAASSEEERKEWVQVIRRVMFAEKGGAIFGQKLQETMKYEQLKNNRRVPEIVEMCVEFLNKHGVHMEGIFRLPGRTSLIRQLREMFDCGERPDFEKMNVDVNTVASLLKQYLRELPEPIIPTNLYEAIMKAVTRVMPVDREKGLEDLITALHLMPSYNYNLLQYICHFLYKIQYNSSQNKMTDNNLATVFAQCIIRPEEDDPALLMGTAGNRSKVVLVLIQEVDTIFKMDYKADGTSVMVDKLLDIEVEPKDFDVQAMSYYKVSTSTTHVSDLLSLDRNSNGMSESLPAPMIPRNCVNDAILANTTKQDLSLTETNSEQDVVDGNTKCKKAEGGSGTVDTNSGDVTDSKMTLTSDTNHTVQTKKQDIAAPVNTPPIPPPRHSRHLNIEAVKCDLSNSESVNDDRTIDSLINTDLTGYTTEDCLLFIETLFTELKCQRSKVKELKKQMAVMKAEHEKEVEKLKKELETEKQATAKAVQKVVAVQSELQAYQLIGSQHDKFFSK